MMTYTRIQNREAAPRIFSGVYPAGIVYADRQREVNGDYKRLAFLPFRSLVIEFERDCPKELRTLIEADAAIIQAKRGQTYQVYTAGQTVLLGG
jgi:hypothetical protein